MTRTNDEQEVLHDLRTVGWLKDSATDTGTISGAVSAGDLLVNVQAGEGTTFAAGDLFRVGAQGNNCDVCEVESVSTDAITIVLPLANAHADAAPWAELILVDVGHTSDDGVTRETSQEETALRSGTTKATHLFITGAVDEAFTMSLLGYNPENLALTLGTDEEGAYTIAAKGGVFRQDDYGTWTSKPWKFEGFRENLDTVTWLLYNAKVVPDQSVNWKTGEAVPLPCRLRSTGARSVLVP